MVAKTAGHNHAFKVAVLQKKVQAQDDGPFALDQLLRRAQDLRFRLVGVQPVVDQITAKPHHHLANDRRCAQHPNNVERVLEQRLRAPVIFVNVVAVEFTNRCRINNSTAVPIAAQQQGHNFGSFRVYLRDDLFRDFNVFDVEGCLELVLQLLHALEQLFFRFLFVSQFFAILPQLDLHCDDIVFVSMTAGWASTRLANKIAAFFVTDKI